jgi:hypothetical protein
MPFRSREKVGFASTMWSWFYEESTPYYQDDFALWHLGTAVTAAQHRAALAFKKLISDTDEDVLFSDGCLRCQKSLGRPGISQKNTDTTAYSSIGARPM